MIMVRFFFSTMDGVPSRLNLFSSKWHGCLILLFTFAFVSKSFGQCSAGADITLPCVNGIVPSTAVLLATPVGGTWSNAAGNPTQATFTPNIAATVAGNLVAGVYQFIYTTTVPACSDTVQVTVPDCQSLCLPVEVRDTLVCVGTVLDLTALVSGFDTLLNANFAAGGVAVGNASAFVADSTVTLTLIASNLLGCSDTTQLVVSTVDCTKSIDLSLSKSISQKMAMLGDTLVYTLRVSNDGQDDATGVAVTDLLNGGVQYLSSATTTGSYDPNTKVWTIGSLATGETVNLVIKARVVAQGVWFNTAQISKANEKDIDSTPGNGKDGEDDIDRECFTVPVQICRGQGTSVELTVPAQYTALVWSGSVKRKTASPCK